MSGGLFERQSWDGERPRARYEDNVYNTLPSIEGCEWYEKPLDSNRQPIELMSGTSLKGNPGMAKTASVQVCVKRVRHIPSIEWCEGLACVTQPVRLPEDPVQAPTAPSTSSCLFSACLKGAGCDTLRYPAWSTAWCQGLACIRSQRIFQRIPSGHPRTEHIVLFVQPLASGHWTRHSQLSLHRAAWHVLCSVCRRHKSASATRRAATSGTTRPDASCTQYSGSAESGASFGQCAVHTSLLPICIVLLLGISAGLHACIVPAASFTPCYMMFWVRVQ